MRPLYLIARDIRNNWKNMTVWAQPYVDAMSRLNSITDEYGADTADAVVLYFLANAREWRGPVAQEIKAELRRLV